MLRAQDGPTVAIESKHGHAPVNPGKCLSGMTSSSFCWDWPEYVTKQASSASVRVPSPLGGSSLPWSALEGPKPEPSLQQVPHCLHTCR